MRKPWVQNLLIALAVYGTLSLLIASGSKTLDLVLVSVLMGMEMVWSAWLLRRLYIRRGPDGTVSFRCKARALPGWQRWMLGETSQSTLNLPKRP